MGWPENIEKQSGKCSEKQFICQFCSPTFSAKFPRVCLQRERQTSPKNDFQVRFNIKIQHRAMIQSRLLSRCSYKPNHFTYASRGKDLEKRIFSSTRSSAESAPLVSPKPILSAGILAIIIINAEIARDCDCAIFGALSSLPLISQRFMHFYIFLEL